MSDESNVHHPHSMAAHADETGKDHPGVDTQTFAHLTYGELVKQFGRDTTLKLSAWDQLPGAEREKFVSAMAVIHAQIFPHGQPANERYASAQAKDNTH
jgi:hypothetical protein